MRELIEKCYIFFLYEIYIYIYIFFAIHSIVLYLKQYSINYQLASKNDKTSRKFWKASIQDDRPVYIVFVKFYN